MLTLMIGPSADSVEFDYVFKAKDYLSRPVIVIRTPSYSYFSIGKHLITAEARDRDGRSTKYEVTVTVIGM